jgi:hypothetical protein
MAQDIAGFRRSHKRIPTSVKLQGDQEEMLAKQAALGRMGQTGSASATESGPKKSLASYQGNANVQRRESGPIGQPSLPGPVNNRMRGDAIAGAKKLTSKAQPVVSSQEVVEEVEVDAGDPYSLRQSLQDTYTRLDDQQAAEERIARQTAAQQATVRAAMGSGEAGMSGAAALLEGDAGRMAESQARANEVAQDLQTAALGSALLGFDLTKDRYDKAEKQQAAAAAMSWMLQYDVDYDEAFEMLNLPESAKSEEQRKIVNDWGDANREADEEAAKEAVVYSDFNSLLEGADDTDDVFKLSDREIFLNTSVEGISVPSNFKPRMGNGGAPTTFKYDGQDHFMYEDERGRIIFVRTDRSGQPLA